MRVRVYGETAKTKEQEYLLKLRSRGNSVQLILVHEDGLEVDGGILLQINPDMKLYRYGCIGKTIGLPLNEENRLKLAEHAE